MSSDRYDPVPLDVEAAHKRWMKQPGFAEAYASLEDEYAALNERLCAAEPPA